MQEVLGELLPLAVVVAASPFPIVALLALLRSPHARTSMAAYLLGWIVSIGAALVFFAWLAGVLGREAGVGPAQTRSGVKLVLGVVMLYLAWREWRARPRPGRPAKMPRWLSAAQAMRPLGAAGAAFGVYAANPKNLMVGFSAGALFQSFALPARGALVAAAVYVLVASSTVVLPALAFLLAEERVRPWLEALRGWLERHQAAVMAALLAAVGIALLGKGVASL